MIQSFLFKSDNNNWYIYDDQHRLSVLVHPEFEKSYRKSVDADPYYLKKYAYLKAHGFFGKPKVVNFRALEEVNVKENLIHANQIVFEVTDSCNLKCTYCAFGELYEGFDERIGKNINTRNAINLLKYVFEHRPKNKSSKMYISFYGGEPLLNIKFIKKIVEISKLLNTDKKFQLGYSMTTNATLIHNHIDFLVENKFNLMISLDGNEKNQSYRSFGTDKKNSFQVVEKNVDMIQHDYPDYFSQYVTFNSVLHDRNSVKEAFEYIYKRYHKIPRIAELNTRDLRVKNVNMLKKIYRSKRNSESEFLNEDSELSRIAHTELSSYRELMNFLKHFSINYYVSNINALLYTEEKFLPTGTCPPFSKKIFLTNRGKLLPCEKIKYTNYMGEVDEKVEIDISEITKTYNFYYNNFVKFCQNCYAYKHCELCLFQMNNIDHISEKNFVCSGFQNQDIFRNKLYHIFSYLEKYPSDFSGILENVILE